MNGANLLQETSAWMDTVDLALCLFIYEVCNDCQFEFASGSDFVNFMNLKPTSRPVAVRPKENLRVCSGGTTEENREYRKSVDRAIENARKLRTSP